MKNAQQRMEMRHRTLQEREHTDASGSDAPLTTSTNCTIPERGQKRHAVEVRGLECNTDKEIVEDAGGKVDADLGTVQIWSEKHVFRPRLNQTT